MSAKVGAYKGHPTIELFKAGELPGAGRGFCFGLSKARLILDHLDNIKAFVEKATADERQAVSAIDEENRMQQPPAGE